MQYLTPELRLFARNHFLEYCNCKACPLHKNRRNIVLWRGYLPTDLLFIGEAPGRTEDLDGFPFTGEAGNKLDQIIYMAQRNSKIFKYCITNTVSCIPLDVNRELRPPKQLEIQACQLRLHQLIEEAAPRCIVLIGKVAADHLNLPTNIPYIEILHPSAILQTDEALQTPKFLKCVSQIVNAVEMYV